MVLGKRHTKFVHPSSLEMIETGRSKEKEYRREMAWLNVKIILWVIFIILNIINIVYCSKIIFGLPA